MKEIFFSIVIPCYNSKATILRALNSCMSQTYKNFEVIIVDDCSRDETVDLLMGYIEDLHDPGRVRLYLQESNSGPANCRNIGWKNAKGNYIAFLDSDDIWHSNKLFICSTYLKGGEVDLLAHDYVEHGDLSVHYLAGYDYRPIRKNYYSLLLRNISQTSCIIVKTELEPNLHSRCWCERSARPPPAGPLYDPQSVFA